MEVLDYVAQHSCVPRTSHLLQVDARILTVPQKALSDLPLISLASDPLSSRPHSSPCSSSSIGFVCLFISLCVTTFLLVTMRLSPYLFAQMSPSQWCPCNLPSYFKFQSLSTASLLSSPGGQSQTEEVTGCHQLGTTFGRAASPAFSLESRLGPSVSLGESLQRPCLW